MYVDKVLPYCTNILDGPKLVYLRTAQRSPEHQRQHFGFPKRVRRAGGRASEEREENMAHSETQNSVRAQKAVDPNHF